MTPSCAFLMARQVVFVLTFSTSIRMLCGTTSSVQCR